MPAWSNQASKFQKPVGKSEFYLAVILLLRWLTFQLFII
ncbi:MULTISPECIES: hypothetical protein [unclassified Paenibacillus]